MTLDAGAVEESSPPLPKRTPESLVLASEQSEYHLNSLYNNYDFSVLNYCFSFKKW